MKKKEGMTVKLSVLDQSPISDGMSAKDALDATIQLAKVVEKAGYHRFWVTEHHDLFGLASPNPSILISRIAAQTRTIEVGAGAVLLPYYKPYFVAETYHMLETMYPGRINLGIGRAPGGPAEASLALADNYLAEVRHYPEKISELISYLEPRQGDSLHATPLPNRAPSLFLLGTSEKSAQLAAEKGMDYAFGHFMSDEKGEEIVETYRRNYKGSGKPYVIVAVDVICCERTEEAERQAQSVLLWRARHDDITAKQRIPTVEEAHEDSVMRDYADRLNQLKAPMIIGNPDQVKRQLEEVKDLYQADELMIVTIVHDPKVKQASYELIAQAFGHDMSVEV